MTLCPRDQTDLNIRKIGDSEGEECPKCNGIWMPYQAVKKLYDEWLLAAPASIYHDYTPSNDYRTWASKIECPEDGVELNTYEFQNIEIDICGKCKGLWLDKGELDKLRIKPTGKDRANNFIIWVCCKTFELILSG